MTKIIIFLDGALCIKFRLENICVCVLRIVRIEQWMFLCIYTHNIKVMLSFGWTNVFLGEVLLTSTWMFTMETMTPHLGCGANWSLGDTSLARSFLTLKVKYTWMVILSSSFQGLKGSAELIFMHECPLVWWSHFVFWDDDSLYEFKWI